MVGSLSLSAPKNLWRVSSSAQATITKYYRLGDLSSRYVFLTVLETLKSKTKVTADSVPREGSLPGLQTAAFSLCPCVEKREL